MDEELTSIVDILTEAKKIRSFAIDESNDKLAMYADSHKFDIIRLRLYNLGRKHVDFVGPEKNYLLELCQMYGAQTNFSNNLNGNRLEYLNTPVDKLDLTPKVRESLQKMNVKYIGELIQKSEQDIKEIKGIGKMAVNVINKELQSYELSLGMKHIDYTRPEKRAYGGGLSI
jgi:hypothetical protein